MVERVVDDPHITEHGLKAAGEDVLDELEGEALTQLRAQAEDVACREVGQDVISERREHISAEVSAAVLRLAPRTLGGTLPTIHRSK